MCPWGGHCSVSFCVRHEMCVCVLRPCACGCTVWGGCIQSDQKQSAPVQSASVPTFTHTRRGTQVCQGAQTYTYTHLDTCRIHIQTRTFSHISHPPILRHPVRPLTIGQDPEPSASPSRLKGPFGKAGVWGKCSLCNVHWFSGMED